MLIGFFEVTKIKFEAHGGEVSSIFIVTLA